MEEVLNTVRIIKNGCSLCVNLPKKLMDRAKIEVGLEASVKVEADLNKFLITLSGELNPTIEEKTASKISKVFKRA